MSLENSPSFILNFSEREMNGGEKHFYQFKSFRLDVAERQLLHDGDALPLTPKAFDVLTLLVERSGHLVEKNELLELVWADSFVEEANIARIVHTLRKVLGEDENGNKFIETVAKKGYRFVAEVSKIEITGEVTENKNENLSDISKEIPETNSQFLTSSINQSKSEPVNNQKQSTRTILISVALLSAILLISLLAFNYQSKSSVSPKKAKSIAVLPFVNTSQDENIEVYSDGITENVINNLSQISSLKVMPKNSVFRYKGKEIEFKKVANDLGVQTLVTGEINKLGDQLIINVHLIDANDGSQIWGKQFTKNSAEVIKTQDEIVQSITSNLHLNLTETEKYLLAKHPTENAEAYDFYLKGQHIGQLNTPDGLNKSIEFYKQATEKDPNFALAYSEIGMRYINLGIYFLPPREMMPLAKAYAEKALKIDNTLSEPQIILGTVALLYEWDWDKAKEKLAQGSVVSLKSIEVFNCAAHVLQVTGRTTEADESLRNALEDDPISISLLTELGCNSYYGRRYDESVRQYHQVLNIEPHNFMALYGLARSLNHTKQYQEAINELEKAKTFMPMIPPIALAEEGYAYAKMGNREEAGKQLKMLEGASKEIYVDPFFMATIYLGLGEKDQSIAWLEKSFEAKSSLMPTIINDVKWDDFRQDERFKSILQRLNVN